MTVSARPLLPEQRWALNRLLGSARLVIASICVAALVHRFIWGLGSITFEPANFFGYLTIQSNLVFVAITTVSGARVLRGRRTGARLDALRAAALTCTLTAGVVFAVIVQQSSLRAIRVDVPWSDVLLHFVLPAVAMVEWALSPRTHRSPWRVLPVVLGYTLAWGGVTMVRGALTGWYPYYFLDPDQSSGIAEFLLFAGAALAMFAVMGALVVGVSSLSAAVWRSREEG